MISRPTRPGTIRNGMQAGVGTLTGEPGRDKCVIAISSALITSGTGWTDPGSTCHPYRRCSKSAHAPLGRRRAAAAGTRRRRRRSVWSQRRRSAARRRSPISATAALNRPGPGAVHLKLPSARSIAAVVLSIAALGLPGTPLSCTGRYSRGEAHGRGPHRVACHNRQRDRDRRRSRSATPPWTGSAGPLRALPANSSMPGRR